MTPPPAAATAPAVRPTRTKTPTPARTRTAPQPARRPRRAAVPAKQPVRAVERAAALTRHRLLVRLARGRAWIGLLAFALIGIVAMQLWVLKLNAGVGRAVEHAGFLERQNTALSIANSEASAGDRVEQLAAAEGMVAAAPGTQRFLRSRGALDTRLAAAALAHPVKVPATSATSESGAGQGAAATSSTAGSSVSTVSSSGSSGSEASQSSSAGTNLNTVSAAGSSGSEASQSSPATASGTPPESSSTAEAPGAGAVGPRG